ncbi:hypothetical protein ACJMK2_034768 [Sinanodonta woodiana]|uniref:Disks large homolog 5 n=1 Tax=Sinanodonta woodiana TaxID=1069815 RepID=A0ABD3WUT8_SINWO
MEEKYKELLELHRSKFTSVIDVERLFPILEGADVLDVKDIAEIKAQPTKPGRVEKLLDILPIKKNLAFKNLCLALETTYPHLLTVMFLGNNQSVLPDTRSLSTTSDSEEDVLNRSQGIEQRSQELKTYTLKIPSYEYEINDSTFLDGKTLGVVPDNRHMRHKHHEPPERYKQGINGENRHDRHRDYDWLKSQCEQAMNELQSLKRQQAETVKRYDHAVKESELVRQNYKTVYGQLQQSREELQEFKSRTSDLLSDKERLEQELKNLQKLRQEDRKEMAELRKQQRDVISESGSSEMLNALDMYEQMKIEYDDLREEYAKTVAAHNSAVSRLEDIAKENTRIQKLHETACHERDAAMLERNGLKQQCTAAIRNWDQVGHERNELKESISKIMQQRDDLVKEMNQALASQLRAKKDLEMASKDRDAALREYTLVMSERDQVHKEIEQLQDKLNAADKKITELEKEKKAAQDEIEILKREIKSALQDRDKGLKERNEIMEKYGDIINRKAELETQRDEFKKDYEMVTQERDIARRERQEALLDRDRILRETYEWERTQKEKAEEMDQFSKETEMLKKQTEKLQKEVLDAHQEAEISKKRRDWAFGERDKIVQERDSIRTLCDNLRRDRDRAVSELAQALRDYDELKKQKDEMWKELKESRDRYENFTDRDIRKQQLNSVGHNHSRDSAIDADLQDFETETLEIEIDGVNDKELGFKLEGGKDDPQFPNDNSIFVSHVSKGSAADGKLKVNDLLVRVNSTDVTNVEKRVAIEAVRNNSGVLNLVVRRRKMTSVKTWQPVQLNLPAGKDLGIHLEQGVYISRISPGSYCAKEGCLAVGDRIASINGHPVENMSSDEVMKMMFQCNDTIMLDVWRQASPINSAGSSPIPVSQFFNPSISDSPFVSSSQEKRGSNASKGWENNSDSTKCGLKKIATSGSQTDSLDSPGPTRRNHKDYKSSIPKDFDHKSRHTVHVIDKALEKMEQFFKPRHKPPPEFRNSIPSHPANTDEEDVLGEFQMETNDKTLTNRQGTTRKRDLEQENSGTWPKCVGKISTTPQGTVILPPAQKQRPTLDAVINGPIPTAKVPPLPPERTRESFLAVKHSPQSSDSTIRYNSASPSPIGSPQPSKSTPYLNQSPFLSSQRSGPFPNDFTGPYEAHSHGNHINSHSIHKVNNTKNPPRMPPIQSSVNPGQYDLHRHDRLGNRANNKDRRHPFSNGCTYSSQICPNTDYFLQGRQYSAVEPANYSGMHGRRSNNLTPEPFHSPPQLFTDRVTGVTLQPTPNSHSKNVPIPSQPAVSQFVHLHTATTHLVSSRFSSPPGTLPDSIPELPPYTPSPYHWQSSPSPSQLSSSMDRFTPTSVDQFSPFPGSSPNVRPLIEIEPSSTFPRKVPGDGRIRIPSNTSVTTNNTSGSVEVEPSSPCSLFSDYNRHLVTPFATHSDGPTYRKRPLPGETRKINIEKTNKPVGFQIEKGPSGGIFVSTVNEKSLAVQAGLVIGDQLLEVCGINMRNATHDLAARVLQQCGNNLTMLVQYNPQKYNDIDDSTKALSSSPSVTNSPDSSHNEIIPRSPRLGQQSSPESPRRMTFKKASPNSSLGITLVGGNAVGIFVHEVQSDSPASGHDGLHCADQILEYNGVYFTEVTLEEATNQLYKPCVLVEVVAQYNPSKYNKVCNKAGDSFYIRAHFDHQAEIDGELSFRKDDILHVEKTHCTGKQGYWYACQEDDDGKKIRAGYIPSKNRMEDELLRRSFSENLNLHDSDDVKVTRRGSGSARRSFFKKKKHQRNNSKDSRELSSFSDASLNSDSTPVIDDLYTYTFVERKEYNMVRPVVLFAPFADSLIQKLCSESPDKYVYCEPTKMNSTQLVMEQGLKDGNFVDYWSQDDHYVCIRTNSIKEICDKNIHSLLKVSPEAVERLHRHQIYPIVIYARHKSYKQLREVKDVQFMPEKLSNKSAKDLFEYCQRTEQDYRHLFSATIQGGNLAEMCQQIKNVINAEQAKAVWVAKEFLR